MQRVAGGADPAELEIEVAAIGEPKAEIQSSGLLAEIHNLRREDIKTLAFYAIAGMIVGMICGMLWDMFAPGVVAQTVEVNSLVNVAVAAASVPVATRTNRIGDTIKLEAAVKKPNPVAKPRNAKACAKCEKAKYAKGITCLVRVQRYMKDMTEVAAYHAVGATAIHGKFPCKPCKKCM